MRPLKLRMKAFISYRDEQIIDFTRFTDGLFLVEGDIGAGKTTIFDAISYALFGKASGDGRDTDDLHCNLVSLGTDTEVELVFSQGGKEYKVTRTIHYPKKREPDDEYDKPKSDAVLEFPDKDPVKNPTKVNKEIESIIGLNKEQFEKIVMLAQGEFRKFLEASSTDKESILKKLIDVSEYERYQNILAESHKRLKTLRESNDTAVKNHMETAFKLPDTEEFESELFLPGNPDLQENLLKLKSSDEAAADAAKAEHNKKINEVTRLTAAREKAKSDNQNIKDLAVSREHLKELQSRKPEMDTLQGRLESVSVVANKICNVIDKHNDLERKHKTASDEISRLDSDLAGIEECLKTASAEAGNDKTLSSEVEAAKAEAAAKRALLHKYDDHSKIVENISIKEKQISSDRESLSGTSEKLDELKEQSDNACAGKEALKDPSAAAVKAQNALEESDKKLKSFAELKNTCAAIEKGGSALQKLGEEVISLCRESAAKLDEYNAKYSVFMREQAARLAKDLGTRIEESGEADCPVCGTHLVKGAKIGLACAEGGLIEEDEVKKAQDAANNAKDRHAEMKASYEAEKARLQAKKDTAVKDCSALLNCSITWDELTKEFLDSRSRMLEDEHKTCEAELKTAKENLKRYEELGSLIEKLQQEISDLSNRKTTLSTTIENVSGELDSLKEQEAKLRTELEFDSKEKAVNRIRTLEESAQNKQKIIDQHKAQLEKLQKEQAAKQASRSEKISYMEELAGEIRDTSRALEEVLSANHFSTVNDALAIIEGIDDTDAWIKKTSEDLNTYKNDITNTGARIAELEEKTKGLGPVDLEAIDQDIIKAEAERDECNERLTQRISMLDNHTAAYNVVMENNRKNAGTEHAWKILNRLSPMAVGSASDNGKISFERYILGAFFSELLGKANQKLIELTAGQYQLNHKTTGERKNEVAGLDVEIINMSEASVISKGSLSGGEKFLTSLSLALGLSELAQDHFGGQTLDSLFIDEGFGTLDDKSLNLTMNVLNSLAGNNSRLVGIISHVDVSDYPIPHKIHVEKRGSASTITKIG